jgi:hypothetical protein
MTSHSAFLQLSMQVYGWMPFIAGVVMHLVAPQQSRCRLCYALLMNDWCLTYYVLHFASTTSLRFLEQPLCNGNWRMGLR